MKYLLAFLTVVMLGGCERVIVEKYLSQGYEMEWQGYAMPGDREKSYTLYNTKTQHRISIDRGKRVIETPNNKALQDYWWWNITMGKEHYLQYNDWRKSKLYEEMLEKQARDYIMKHPEWQHPAGNTCQCRLESVMRLLREGRIMWRKGYEY